MNGLSTIRRRGKVWGRHVLGIFLASWLAVAMQPCAVAGDLEHECPHCPEESMHAGHHRETLSSSDCTIGGQLASEGRIFQLKLDDLPVQMPVFAGHSLDETGLTLGSKYPPSYERSNIHPGGPPLNVLNCVYLK